MSLAMDSVDREILRILRLDARRPNAQIAEEVGLSPSACHRRIKLLERRDVIRGYTIIAGAVDGQERRVNFVVQVTLDRQTEDYLARFEHAVRQVPEIRECFLMAGEVDYWLRIETDAAAAYEQVHGLLSRLPGVARINSNLAMRDALRPRQSRR
ncbi:Lrp/AsnC family transcriptional regulator [Sphingomonas sp.]|uniref:Lrp/AsnC family transcriptional regulator n=1 Tax=Sphingomonas sp. TaxID=28214 RepID=UPI000DB6D889|nr:Lrp/AsnC family transcriptional regulator [Sphingomonas sp.]PZU10210.1 MAG: transcriptional regulator [Sphingomonas sp.]